MPFLGSAVVWTKAREIWRARSTWGEAPLLYEPVKLAPEASKQIAWLFERSQVSNQITSLLLAWNTGKRHDAAR
jgi:hypothetical protein